MSRSISEPAAARTMVLDIPVRVPSAQSPYWHRPRPLVAVMHVDPGHQMLRACFPDGWTHLVRAKAMIDAAAAAEAPQVTDDLGHLHRISPLLESAGYELLRFAASERDRQGGGVIAQAEDAADRLAHYAHTMEWKPVRLTRPEPGRPWLYCGPLNTWSMHTSRSKLAFLVLLQNAELQPEVDMIGWRLPDIRATVAGILRGPVALTKPVQPAMHVTDLLLAGGEPGSGHKNFAHFLPLEVPNSAVDDAEFTVVFGNVHSERLSTCSLRLFRHLQPAAPRCEAGDVLRSSLAWFRCHDLAHFWRSAAADGQGSPAEGLTAFERMALEEAYADVIGLLCARSLSDSPAVEQAFLAELLRYLSRRRHHFADSTAAALEVGWLIWLGVPPGTPGDRWLDTARPLLEDLARCLHRTLWQADPSDLGRLRSALAAGAAFQDDLAELYQVVPTDIEYTFG